MKRIKKVFLLILTILLSLLILYNLYNVINLKILKKDLTFIQGYALLEVMSRSMEPTILKNDFIVINKNDKEYKKGDIITFYDNKGMLVTHRIIDVKKSHVITQGDHNKTEDGLLSKKKIVGKYSFRIKGAGKVIALLKNPVVAIIIIILIILISMMQSENQVMLEENDQVYQEFLKYKNKKEILEERPEVVKLDENSNRRKKHKNNHKKRKKRAKRKQRRG